MGDSSIVAAVTGLGSAIGAAGALGTACFGIVEALKWTPIGTAGYSQINKYLEIDLMQALAVAYGPSYNKLLRAQYRQDSTTQTAIAKALRQAVRLGLTPSNAEAIARNLGTVDGMALKAAVTKVASGADQLDPDSRGPLDASRPPSMRALIVHCRVLKMSISARFDVRRPHWRLRSRKSPNRIFPVDRSRKGW
jgi:hypothetical protein